MKTICINGKTFGSELITGIERYVYIIIKYIDDMMTAYDDIWLVCPSEKDLILPELNNIKIARINMSNKLTQTIQMRKFVKRKKAILFDLSGGLCVIKGSIGCIHDIRAMKYKIYDSTKAQLVGRIDFWFCKHLAKTIVTVSETSKKEIVEYLRVKPQKIKVIYSGWEHMKSIKEDESIWDKYPEIKKNKYYYSVGSKMKHKNFKWILKNAQNNKDKLFVIAGGGIDNFEDDINTNVIVLGYVTDEENKALMRNCIAYLQPSEYEGFGLPPLEALSCGADIMISDIPVFREIYSKCATFFSTSDYSFDFKKAIIDKNDIDACLRNHSLYLAAKQWYGLMKKT